MNNLGISNSILNDLTNDDIREVHNDYLLQKEFKFNYIIDADEISEYCNPFRKNENKKLGIVSDEQFIIEFLFRAHGNRIFLVDDYFSEFIDLRIHLLSSIAIKQAKEDVVKYQKTLTDFINNIHQHDNTDDEYIRKIILAYSFLLSISTGTYKNDLRKLNYLFSAPNVNYEGKIDNSEIDKFFRAYKKDVTLINKLYGFINAEKESKKLDINAIYKTYHLTNSSLTKSENKEIFYFISSSTTEVRKIRDLIIERRLDNEFKIDDFPKSYSLIRSKKQIFALLIYNMFGEGYEGRDSFEEFLRKFNQGVERYKTKIKKSGVEKNHILISALEESKLLNQEIIENLAIRQVEYEYLNRKKEENNLKIESFERLLTYGFKGKDIVNIQANLGEQIDKINRVLTQNFNSISIFKEFGNIRKFIDYSLFEITIIDEFLKELTSPNFKIEFDRGADPVESVFNAFPTLFKFNFYQNHIFPLLSEIKGSFSTQKNTNDNEVLKNFVNNSKAINDLSSKNFLPYIFYLLLIVKYTSRGKKMSSNFLTYKYGESLIYKRENLIDEMENSSKEQFTDIEIENLKGELADIYAISCWAARRSRKYAFAYDLSSRASTRFPEDPRFDFSLALNGYCWKYECQTLARYELPFDENYNENGEGSIIYFGETAIKKYRAILNYDSEDYLKQSFIALLNLQAFSLIAKFKEIYEKRDNIGYRQRLRGKKTKAYLVKARAYIEEMYDKLSVKPKEKNQELLKKFPEYIHTEVFLVYYEIQHDNYFSLKQNKKEKLDIAIKNIEYAIENCEYRYDLQNRCNHLLNKLKSI